MHFPLLVWEQRKLKDVAKIIGGGTPSTKIKEYWNGNINWYSPIEIGNQTFVSSSRKKISELGLKKSSAKLLPGGNTILFTSRAGIGDMAIMKTAGSTNQGFQSWVVRSNLADVYFLYSLGKKLKKQALRKASGSTFLEISNSEVKKLLLFLPSLREQKEIGKIFKLIDKLLSLQQRKLEQLNLLKKGLLQKIFSDNDFRPNLRFKNFNEKWKQHKLGSIVHWSKGNHLKKSTLNSKYDGYEVIHYADLYKFKPVLSKVIHWSRNNTGTIIPANSLLFPMSDVTPDGLARTTAMMKNGVRAGSDILIATVKNNNAEFLSYQINLYSKRIVPLVTGTTIRHINSKALSTLNIKIPTNSEQNIISKLFIFFENFVDLQQSKINQLKLLKKFILNNMFI